jgi:hypothetical protein
VRRPFDILGVCHSPRESHRHSGNGHASSTQSFLEQAPDGDRRNMAFYNKAADFCGMARS